jgi:hypothetical protein
MLSSTKQLIMPDGIMPNVIMANVIMPNAIMSNFILSNEVLIRDPYTSDISMIILTLHLLVKAMLYQLSSICFQVRLPRRELLQKSYLA